MFEYRSNTSRIAGQTLVKRWSTTNQSSVKRWSNTVFVELFFVLTSLWMDQYYYVFGFLLLVWTLLCITCAEISIVLAYFALCSEDYKWWWRSALVPATSGCYLYAYCVYYFLQNLNMPGTVPQLLYFSYMGLVALAFSFVTGATGFLASLWFTRVIYAAVHVD